MIYSDEKVQIHKIARLPEVLKNDYERMHNILEMVTYRTCTKGRLEEDFTE